MLARRLASRFRLRACCSSATTTTPSVKRIREAPTISEFMRWQREQERHRNEHYVLPTDQELSNARVFIEVYGCQMNVADTEVVWSLLLETGRFTKATSIDDADVILLMTCSIREGAEQKIWRRLQYFNGLKRKGRRATIGLLGCMAERLKQKALEKDKIVQLVCGPDAYRSLPGLLTLARSGHKAVDVLLSVEETYADIMPVQLNELSKSGFVSIQRGCDNMCSFCVVPFVRGRERSRPIASILEEIRELSSKGVKEVTLLGQNVNSYRDTSEVQHALGASIGGADVRSRGFNTVYKEKQGGRRFADLLAAAAEIDPEMRIRFTSPHPKDFPDAVLDVVAETANVCNTIHLPAQSGNSDTLAAMRRGYTRESYLDLVNVIRSRIPRVSITGDFIAGFCGETEQAHRDTLTLIEATRYNFIYCFPYSMREATRAFHQFADDVPEEVKKRRHMEIAETFMQVANQVNESEIGRRHLVLIEKDSKRNSNEWQGLNEANTRVHFPKDPDGAVPGDYVEVEIVSATSHSMRAAAVGRTTLQEFHRNNGQRDREEAAISGL